MADLAEVKRIDKRLNAAALAYIRDFYSMRDQASGLLELYHRARLLSKKHDDQFNTIGITKSGDVIGAVLSLVVPVSRSIEFFAPDLVEKAGEKRRF